MKIYLFRDKTGTIYGKDPKRITAKLSGTLAICGSEIAVEANEYLVFPLLAYGATGNYAATFTTAAGEVYDLGYITVSHGKVVPLSETEAQILELASRLDEKEREIIALKQKIIELENIFDTNSLNFLITPNIEGEES